MESLTDCETNRKRVAVKMVRRDTTGPGIETPTCYQANKIKVAVRMVRLRETADLAWNRLLPVDHNGIRTVRRATTGPAIESLTAC